MKAKKCPVCNSAELQYVYYAPSAKDEPTMWEDMVDTGYSPMILFKRIECKKCGASVPQLVMTLDDAVGYWNDINDKTNHRYVLQRIGAEDVREVERGVMLLHRAENTEFKPGHNRYGDSQHYDDYAPTVIPAEEDRE